MGWTENVEENDLADFLILTSDTSIRNAAYPLDEWINSGGTLLDYGGVSNQDKPPIITTYKNTLRGLLYQPYESDCEYESITQNLTVRAGNISSHLIKVKGEKMYRWLNQSEYFKTAKSRFDKVRATTKSEKMLSEFSEFRFLRIVALHIGSRVLSERAGFQSLNATSRQLNQAEGHANKLRKLLTEGVRLANYENQNHLKKLLEQLVTETELAVRKPKAGENFENSKCLERMTYQMLLYLGAASPSILLDMAGMIGWLADASTIDRLVKKAKNRYRLELARALKIPAL